MHLTESVFSKLMNIFSIIIHRLLNYTIDSEIIKDLQLDYYFLDIGYSKVIFERFIAPIESILTMFKNL